MNKKINVELITKETSKNYGRLMDSTGMMVAYKDDKFSFTKHLDIIDFSESLSFSLVESYLPNKITEKLEYHANTAEVLIPTTGDIILVLALGNENPDETSLKAFLLPCGQGFAINPYVWHYAPIAVNEIAKTFVIFNNSTPDNDVILRNLKDLWGYKITIE